MPYFRVGVKRMADGKARNGARTASPQDNETGGFVPNRVGGAQG